MGCSGQEGYLTDIEFYRHGKCFIIYPEMCVLVGK